MELTVDVKVHAWRRAEFHLEGGSDPGFELVLVDEYQDASQARARLTRGLAARPGRYLVAVGAYWQAMNRFAGSGLSVMTRFEGVVRTRRQSALTTTFRCPHTICDVAPRFVSKNHAQFNEAMRSAQPGSGAPLRVVFDDDPGSAFDAVLSRLSAAVASGEVPPGWDGAGMVDMLDRLGFQRDLVVHTPSNLLVRSLLRQSARLSWWTDRERRWTRAQQRDRLPAAPIEKART